MVKNLPAMQETSVLSLDQEDPLEKEWQPTPVFLPGVFHGQRSMVGHSQTLSPLLSSHTTFSSFCVTSASASLLQGHLWLHLGLTQITSDNPR